MARIAVHSAAGSGRQPSTAAARVPPLLERSLRAADADDTSRSGASQLSNPWLDSPPVLPLALAASHQQQRPVDRRFPIAVSLRAAVADTTAVTSRSGASQPSNPWLACIAARPAGGSGHRPSAAARGLPLLDLSLRASAAAVTAATSHSGASLSSTLARITARLVWRLWPPAISSSAPWTAASRSQPPSYRRLRNRRHFSQWCFAAEQPLARVATRPAGGSGRQPSAAAREPPLFDRSLRAAAAAVTAATSGSGASKPSTPWLASPPVWYGGSGCSHQPSAARGPPLSERSLRAADAAAAATSRALALLGSRRHPSCRWLSSPAISHHRPVDRRFQIAASELPPLPQPPPLLAAVLRDRAPLARFAARLAWRLWPPATTAVPVARGPPLPDRSLRADAAATAATSRSGASQPSARASWLASRSVLLVALVTSHQQRPVDRRFPIAASELPPPPQLPPLLAAVLRSRAPLARFAARLAWRLWLPAISSGPWTAES